MQTQYLNESFDHARLRGLQPKELPALCEEVRGFLIENVSRTGGHLSSNLGTVDLTVAMAYAFDFDKDAVLWDVGHQCYTYKMLTGRTGQFCNLRKKGGLSGFPCPEENPYDHFIAGHGSTALSAAIGIATAKKLKGEPGYVIAVIGDGAFTGGMVYEGLNNVRPELDNLILVLNDNKMSISKNVGNVAKYLNYLRTSSSYSTAKKTVEAVLATIPVLGKPVSGALVRTKGLIKRALYHSTFFEELGIQYYGILNGNDVNGLVGVFKNLQTKKGPFLIHIETMKGKGFMPAEHNPGAFHGVSSFDIQAPEDPDHAPDDSFSTIFGQTLTDLAKQDARICAITAAMKYGTGLQFFYRAHKTRFFDVGMAEAHAVTFAAGLAKQGMRPVVAVYSTFMQRAYDQFLHDVMLQKADVLFALDRAGLVPGDGETHQGIYDVAFLSQVADMPVFSPATYEELRHWLPILLGDYSGPRAIRYPKGREDARLEKWTCTGALYDLYTPGKKHNEKATIALVTYGGEAAEAMEAADILYSRGVAADVYKLMQVNPLPKGFVKALEGYEQIIVLEEGVAQGGVGEHLGQALRDTAFKGAFEIVAVPNHGIDHCGVAELRKDFGLDAASIADRLSKQSGVMFCARA